MKIKVEKWKSDKGNREDHYFVTKGKMQYFFGYNPKLVKGSKLKAILKIVGIEK